MKDTRHIAVLDGLRALAILLVLGRHSVIFHRETPDIFTFGDINLAAPLLNGLFGVDLFFVLSGFLITRQLLDSWVAGGQKARALGTYLWRRFWRIAPAYYVVLTILCAQILPVPLANPETVWGWRYIYHLLFLQDYWPPDISVVFWSLAIEAKFYLAAPFVLAACLAFGNKCGKYLFLTACFFIIPLLRHWTALGNEAHLQTYLGFFNEIRNCFHLALDPLLAGMGVAVVWHDKDWREKLQHSRVANTIFTIGSLIIFWQLCLRAPVEMGISSFDIRWLPSLLGVGFAMMMLGLLANAFAAPVFAYRGWGFTARISYSLYLVHLQIFLMSRYFAQRIFGADLTPLAEWASVLPIYLPASFLIAWILYRCVEKPAIDFSRRLT